jgi:histidinol-phosphate aminotransferase
MPTFRPELAAIPVYEAGHRIEDVAREMGADPAELIKLASNESPLPPFPEVVEAIAKAAAGVNRYPDNGWYDLGLAMAPLLGVDTSQLWFGAGSSELLRTVCLAAGGPATTMVHASPSFVVYPLAATIAGSRPLAVPLDAGHRHDLEAMAAAIRSDTSLVFVCNPNNPTGTYLTTPALAAFMDVVPERVLVVVDEAYHEFATAPDYSSAIGLAVERPNVVVTRTFSKLYGLAALRVGYAVAQAPTLREIRRAQAPFTVNGLAQVAAREALRHQDRVKERVALNAAGREMIEVGLTARGVDHVPSQTNFVYFRLGPDTQVTLGEFLARGLILRGFEGGWIRVTVGTAHENRRFLEAVDLIRGANLSGSRRSGAPVGP